MGVSISNGAQHLWLGYFCASYALPGAANASASHLTRTCDTHYRGLLASSLLRAEMAAPISHTLLLMAVMEHGSCCLQLLGPERLVRSFNLLHQPVVELAPDGRLGQRGASMLWPSRGGRNAGGPGRDSILRLTTIISGDILYVQLRCALALRLTGSTSP